MRAHELEALLSTRMREKGYGGKEITCNGGFQIITDVFFCETCNEFHIVTEPTEDAKEILGIKDDPASATQG